MKRFLLIPLFILVGCNEYTTQVCTEDVRVDVPGLEAKWTLAGYNQEHFQLVNSAAQFKRLAKGVYLIGNKKQAVFTCQIGGRTLLEEEIGTNHWANYLISKTGNGFDLTVMVFDKPTLDAANVTYAIEETRENSERHIAEGNKVLVVDNAKLADPKKVVDLLAASSFIVHFY